MSAKCRIWISRYTDVKYTSERMNNVKFNDVSTVKTYVNSPRETKKFLKSLF